MRHKLNMISPASKTAIVAACIIAFSGCSTEKQAHALQDDATRNIEAEQAKAAQSPPAVSTHASAWLMGETVQVLATPSPILTQIVTYHPAQKVTLDDLAAWVYVQTGLIIDTAEVRNSNQQNRLTTQPAQGAGVGAATPGNNVSGMNPAQMGMYQPIEMSINYEGQLSGLLDVAANKNGVWWKFRNGRGVFFRTETRTFYLPALSRSSSGSLSMSSTAGSGGGAAGGSGTPSSQPATSPSPSSSASSSGSGGSTNTSSYAVDVWTDLKKTVEAVGSGANVDVNPSMTSVTVTGTPPQINNVEEWVKGATDNLSQQVSITVHVYNVKVTREDNYNVDPNVIFKGSATGVALSPPQAPSTVSGFTPLNIAANVLSTASGNLGKYTGSQLAVQALSTMGDVTETMKETVVTLNGQPAPMQIANKLSYLAQTTPGSATVIGTAPVPPTLTPGQVTTGFTAMFLPKILNGKIFLAMNLDDSTLVNMGVSSSGGSTIQTPNVDASLFPQNVMLTPGDSLLLTGLQINNGAVNKSGLGTLANFFLGTGIDSTSSKQLIAIVITAKVL